MNDSNVILDFDGNLQGYSGDKEILDLDIDASATPSNISMEFKDNKNDTTYYTQIPIRKLEDDIILDKVISLDKFNNEPEIDLIEILENDYPITSAPILENLQQQVEDKINTISRKLPYLSEVSSFPLVKNTIYKKKKSSRKQDKGKKKKRSRKVT